MNGKKTITTFLVLLLTLAFAAAVYADVAIKPSQPTSMTFVKNETTGGLSGTVQNHTRGYIYYYNIDESAPTQKWKA
ncbi:hypothetical protein KY362_07125, partial [Candidatus Woesearchaeota archaeon]|nr:hypothetical protein [Candidatus Woesearchaeota archaeon]